MELEDKIKQVEGLQDTRLNFLGLRFTPAKLVAAFALISTITGSLYGGFLLYQKVESLANLDLGSISSQMSKTSAEVLRIEEHANAIKIELKKDMTDLRNSQWSLESKVDTKLQSVDTKLTNYDTKLDRFEIKVEKVKTDIEKRIQESLDNPLAN
jgi:Skp family chaperone for outer membrane proteins|tara:strand:+ start:53 stop:517 length:465 start_codon:yes stop_codon:yes gene_type:complete